LEVRLYYTLVSIGDIQTSWIVQNKQQIDEARLVLVDIVDKTHVEYDGARYHLYGENT